MVQGRPPLRDNLMREVRQRCGFGCVICGRPIYDYDHILGWAKVCRHVASEITLLCDNHHREKNAKLLPDQVIINANQKPFNITNGVTSPHTLNYSGARFSLIMGSYRYQGSARSGAIHDAIRIDGEPLFGVKLEDGHFLLNLSIYDSKQDLILLIADNELVMNTRSWDIEVIGPRITIREGKGSILFDVVFRPPSTVAVRRGRFLYNGVELLVTPKWTALLNNRGLLDISATDCMVGLDIGEHSNPASGGFRFSGVRRDNWDREDAIRWARETASKASQQAEAVLNELLDTDGLDLWSPGASDGGAEARSVPASYAAIARA